MTEPVPAAVPRRRKPAPRWLAGVYLAVAPLVMVGIVVMGVALIVSGWHTRAHDLSDSGTSWAAPFVTGIVVVSVAGLMLLLVGGLLLRQRRRSTLTSASEPADL